ITSKSKRSSRCWKTICPSSLEIDPILILKGHLHTITRDLTLHRKNRLCCFAHGGYAPKPRVPALRKGGGSPRLRYSGRWVGARVASLRGSILRPGISRVDSINLAAL